MVAAQLVTRRRGLSLGDDRGPLCHCAASADKGYHGVLPLARYLVRDKLIAHSGVRADPALYTVVPQRLTTSSVSPFTSESKEAPIL